MPFTTFLWQEQNLLYFSKINGFSPISKVAFTIERSINVTLLPHTILKVLVGSHAHGLATPDSDHDYRSVFVIPTEDMFKLGFKPPSTQWTKGQTDETAWEVGSFLSLATQGHPLVLETFLAPIEQSDRWGQRLRALFPDVWSSEKAFESFVNYAHNQRQKFLEKKDGRPEKYAAAYVRVLQNLCELLETGTFTIHIAQTELGKKIFAIKQGNYRTGEVIDVGETLLFTAQKLRATSIHTENLTRINSFLIDTRREYLADLQPN
jgi:hypothetical protein